MGGYRKFKLENSIGETYELTNYNFKTFFYQPKGLGFKKKLTEIRIGNRRKFKNIKYDLPQIKGELIFYNVDQEGIYDDYSEFMRFVSKSPLKIFYYTPSRNRSETESESIYCECEIVDVDKEDIDPEDSTLHVPVSFEASTFWQSGKIHEKHLKKEIEESGTFTFPLNIPFTFGKDSLSDIRLNYTGTVDSPINIRIVGESVNPFIRLYDANGKEYGGCRLVGTFDELVIESDDNKQAITLIKDGQAYSDGARYQDLDIAQDDEYYLTFLKLKPGETKMVITFGDEFFGDIYLSWHDEYYSF